MNGLVTIHLSTKDLTEKVSISKSIPTVSGADMSLKLFIPIINYIGFHILRLSQVALIARPGRL